MKNTYTLFGFALLIFTSGCALSPQVVVVNPELNIEGHLSENKPTALKLDVVDTRSSSVIGQRGGVYKETSYISTDDNMTTSLERRLVTALNSLGYFVADKGKEAGAILTVRIKNIKYFYHTEKTLNNIETQVEIQAVCQKENNEYTGSYKATRKKDVLKAPSEEGNTRLVNEAIAVVLQQMLKDKELIAFIDN